MSRWGFTPRKPAKLSREQIPKVVEDRLNAEHPEIVKMAKKENEIFHENAGERPQHVKKYFEHKKVAYTA